MLAARFLLGSLGLLAAAACDVPLPRLAAMMTDGCYYAHGRAVFRISGDHGRVLIPGDVTTFTVRRRRTLIGAAEVTFAPAFLFDGSDNGPSRVEAWYDRRPWTFEMVAGTDVPTVRMNWSAYGESDVVRGAPC
ncbi:MAG TPA: hypothetical protein VF702_01475 [Allosphingosinicella sp.]|jgi:hypothetical protein